MRSFEMRNDKDVTDYFLFFTTTKKFGYQLRMKMIEVLVRRQTGCVQNAGDGRDPEVILCHAPPRVVALEIDPGVRLGDEFRRDVSDRKLAK